MNKVQRLLVALTTMVGVIALSAMSALANSVSVGLSIDSACEGDTPTVSITVTNYTDDPLTDAQLDLTLGGVQVDISPYLPLASGGSFVVSTSAAPSGSQNDAIVTLDSQVANNASVQSVHCTPITYPNPVINTACVGPNEQVTTVTFTDVLANPLSVVKVTINSLDEVVAIPTLTYTYTTSPGDVVEAVATYGQVSRLSTTETTVVTGGCAPENIPPVGAVSLSCNPSTGASSYVVSVDADATYTLTIDGESTTNLDGPIGSGATITLTMYAPSVYGESDEFLTRSYLVEGCEALAHGTPTVVFACDATSGMVLVTVTPDPMAMFTNIVGGDFDHSNPFYEDPNTRIMVESVYEVGSTRWGVSSLFDTPDCVQITYSVDELAYTGVSTLALVLGGLFLVTSGVAIVSVVASYKDDNID